VAVLVTFNTHSTLTLVYVWCCYGGENRYWVHLNIASSQCHSGCAYEQIKQSNGPNNKKMYAIQVKQLTDEKKLNCINIQAHI